MMLIVRPTLPFSLIVRLVGLVLASLTYSGWIGVNRGTVSVRPTDISVLSPRTSTYHFHELVSFTQGNDW